MNWNWKKFLFSIVMLIITFSVFQYLIETYTNVEYSEIKWYIFGAVISGSLIEFLERMFFPSNNDEE